VIIPRHTEHPASISATRIAQFSQKRACPHGTNANPSRGAIRHTLQNCDCHGRRWRRCSRGFLTDMSPYLTKQENIYSVILPIYNVAYNRASVFSLQIFLSPLPPAPPEVLIAAYCCFATPSMSTPAISVAPFDSISLSLWFVHLCKTRCAIKTTKKYFKNPQVTRGIVSYSKQAIQVVYTSVRK